MRRLSRARTVAIVAAATSAVLATGGIVAAYADETPSVTLSGECVSPGVFVVTPTVVGGDFVTWAYNDVLSNGEVRNYQQGSGPVESIGPIEISVVVADEDSGNSGDPTWDQPAFFLNLRSWDDPHGALAGSYISPADCI